MKCDVCNKAVETQFLDKIKGTYIKKKGKKKAVCQSCQKKLSNEEILKKL
jgi:DNA polymerase II large subunit